MATPVWTRLRPVARDIGGFAVQRALPSARARAVGPFVFLDQMGPAIFRDGQALDVPPHPHIGLSTLTWLIEGEIEHRDSLGVRQTIRPGELNWMTAGRGVVHSERSPAHERRAGARLFGVQAWVALPQAEEEADPRFQHVGADRLPRFEAPGVTAVLVLGAAWGLRAPVETPTQTFFADVTLAPGAEIAAPETGLERALWVLSGAVETPDGPAAAGEMLIAPPGAAVRLKGGAGGARVIALGGAPLDGPRRMWWNFVSHSAARIERAADDWRAGRFPSVPGDDDFVPAPAR